MHMNDWFDHQPDGSPVDGWWYLSKEDTPEGPRYWAEVITKPGEGSQSTLYTTKFHTDVNAAVNDAEAWMTRNGVTHGANGD